MENDKNKENNKNKSDFIINAKLFDKDISITLRQNKSKTKDILKFGSSIYTLTKENNKNLKGNKQNIMRFCKTKVEFDPYKKSDLSSFFSWRYNDIKDKAIYFRKLFGIDDEIREKKGKISPKTLYRKLKNIPDKEFYDLNKIITKYMNSVEDQHDRKTKKSRLKKIGQSSKIETLLINMVLNKNNFDKFKKEMDKDILETINKEFCKVISHRDSKEKENLLMKSIIPKYNITEESSINMESPHNKKNNRKNSDNLRKNTNKNNNKTYINESESVNNRKSSSNMNNKNNLLLTPFKYKFNTSENKFQKEKDNIRKNSYSNNKINLKDNSSINEINNNIRTKNKTLTMIKTNINNKLNIDNISFKFAKNDKVKSENKESDLERNLSHNMNDIIEHRNNLNQNNNSNNININSTSKTLFSVKSRNDKERSLNKVSHEQNSNLSKNKDIQIKYNNLNQTRNNSFINKDRDRGKDMDRDKESNIESNKIYRKSKENDNTHVNLNNNSYNNQNKLILYKSNSNFNKDKSDSNKNENISQINNKKLLKKLETKFSALNKETENLSIGIKKNILDTKDDHNGIKESLVEFQSKKTLIYINTDKINSDVIKNVFPNNNVNINLYSDINVENTDKLKKNTYDNSYFNRFENVKRMKKLVLEKNKALNKLSKIEFNNKDSKNYNLILKTEENNNNFKKSKIKFNVNQNEYIQSSTKKQMKNNRKNNLISKQLRSKYENSKFKSKSKNKSETNKKMVNNIEANFTIKYNSLMKQVDKKEIEMIKNNVFKPEDIELIINAKKKSTIEKLKTKFMMVKKISKLESEYSKINSEVSGQHSKLKFHTFSENFYKGKQKSSLSEISSPYIDKCKKTNNNQNNQNFRDKIVSAIGKYDENEYLRLMPL